jgi:hypothetical protein
MQQTVSPVVQISVPSSPWYAASVAPFDSPEGMTVVGSLIMVALMAGVMIGRRHASRATVAIQVKTCSASLEDFEPECSLSFESEEWRFLGTRFCPVCFAEYIAGTVACEDCGIELVEEMDVPEQMPHINESLVRIPNLPNYVKGQLVRQYLAANRIPSMVLRNSFCDMLETDLFVFESDVLRARKLIRQFLSDAGELHTA